MNFHRPGLLARQNDLRPTGIRPMYPLAPARGVDLGHFAHVRKVMLARVRGADGLWPAAIKSRNRACARVWANRFYPIWDNRPKHHRRRPRAHGRTSPLVGVGLTRRLHAQPSARRRGCLPAVSHTWRCAHAAERAAGEPTSRLTLPSCRLRLADRRRKAAGSIQQLRTQPTGQPIEGPAPPHTVRAMRVPTVGYRPVG